MAPTRTSFRHHSAAALRIHSSSASLCDRGVAAAPSLALSMRGALAAASVHQVAFPELYREHARGHIKGDENGASGLRGSHPAVSRSQRLDFCRVHGVHMCEGDRGMAALDVAFGGCARSISRQGDDALVSSRRWCEPECGEEDGMGELHRR
eukprot:CAMPEP_0115876192 /NCGR_PEP_ID=MMETSP0287-20121206/25521_1 /TAXON_ID=412157 /ORGANISM="Chrysochromulina rotalis, Strain UIO044" /LENGTH=151 /DNA_ID=CAMNT_0003331549 /DNA_START=83 /DNA_END=534 /DNA_ORIENTATION=+